MTDEPAGIAVLKEVVEFIETRQINYWLGRGRFRHFTLTGEFGDTESDIDFHVLRGAEAALRTALPELLRRQYIIEDGVARHKLALRKGTVAIEFVYLDQVRGNPLAFYHETVYPLRKRFICPANVLGQRRIQMFGVLVRVPEEEYLPCIYGLEWRENIKGSGGIHI